MLKKVLLVIFLTMIGHHRCHAEDDSVDERQKLLKTFRDEFVEIKPGQKPYPKRFQMGNDASDPSQRPAHAVVFDNPFSIAKYEVPQNLWQSVTGKNPSRWKGERNSVEMLSFDEAVGFCQKVTNMMRAAKLIADDLEIRLPTEAEWEFCARAGTTTSYSFGNDVDKLNEFGWSTHNASGNDPPVGAKKPNPWGLYDIHGYLWEWCLDHGHDSYSSAPDDGSAWVKSGNAEQRVLRGGSWKDKAPKLTSSYRRLASKNLRDDAVGLRCVLSKVKK